VTFSWPAEVARRGSAAAWYWQSEASPSRLWWRGGDAVRCAFLCFKRVRGPLRRGGVKEEVWIGAASTLWSGIWELFFGGLRRLVSVVPLDSMAVGQPLPSLLWLGS
jgi:hypothetical protein